MKTWYFKPHLLLKENCLAVGVAGLHVLLQRTRVPGSCIVTGVTTLFTNTGRKKNIKRKVCNFYYYITWWSDLESEPNPLKNKATPEKKQITKLRHYSKKNVLSNAFSKSKYQEPIFFRRNSLRPSPTLQLLKQSWASMYIFLHLVRNKESYRKYKENTYEIEAIRMKTISINQMLEIRIDLLFDLHNGIN